MTEDAAPTAVAGLRADGVRFDERDARLLRAVAETGSVSAAADRLERSRARATSRLEELETAFGSLVERHRGGPDGGGSRLTTDGAALLARFGRLRATLAGTAAAEESVLTGEVTEIDGEIATVATTAGPVSAVLADSWTATSPETIDSPETADDRTGDGRPDDDRETADDTVGTAVDVTVRADAVTLHAPDATPRADATSARNRFEGVVRRVERGDALAEAVVAVGNETVRATVTADSADRLALAPEGSVVVSFKATATRAVPRPHDPT